jgi:alpha-tubulin suppressor-like RCC1 family protein
MVFTFGQNELGQLGLGHRDMVHVPRLVESLKDKFVIAICCGGSHMLAITGENSLKLNRN